MTSVNLNLHANQSDYSQFLQSSPVARSIVSVWSVESNGVSEEDKLCPFKEELWKSESCSCLWETFSIWATVLMCGSTGECSILNFFNI